MSSKSYRVPAAVAPPSYDEAMAEDDGFPEVVKPSKVAPAVDANNKKSNNPAPPAAPVRQISSYHQKHMVLPDSSGIPNRSAFAPQSFGEHSQPAWQSNLVYIAQPAAAPASSIVSTSYGVNANPPVQYVQPSGYHHQHHSKKKNKKNKSSESSGCVIS
jgi:hypothetical protein